MAVVARNAYKGYTYQEYIHLFFTALMDTEKKIAEIEAEIISEHNFDDLYILFKDQTKYFVQIKNYPQTELSDISISDDEITIGTNKSKFANNAINIVIINTSLINETNAMVFGLPCVKKDNVYIIPLTSERIGELLNDMYDVITNIKDSLLKNNINFMSRFVSFNFDEEFIKQILRKYSDIDLFDNISQTNFDYFSIQEFYAQLKSILQYLPNTLTLYQYYSFVLINLITERYDIKYDYELLYNILYYANANEINEKNIFSTGSFWKAYLMYNYNSPITFEAYVDKNYKRNYYQKISISKDSSSGFFEILQNAEINTDLNSIFTGEETELEKVDLITNYLVNVMILNDTSCELYSMIREYLQTESFDPVYAIICMCEKHDIRPVLSKGILPRIKYILMELGLVRENNIFLDYDLESLITEKSTLDSYNVNNYVVSFLRLANYEGRNVDINSLSLYYRMHYAHKDYSVENLGKILRLFEEKELIKEDVSEELIIRTIKQSERGVKHLYLEYCNSKPLSYIKERINKQKPDELEYLDVFKLTTDRINELSNEFILFRLGEILEYHRHGKIIEYNEIENAIFSKYSNIILDLISKYKYSVKDVPSDFVSLFKDINIINMKPKDKEQKEPKSIIEQGYILKENIGTIDVDSFNCVDLASYADGWYCCFPYPEIFSNYPENVIAENISSIIHSALYAKIPKIHKTGNWWLCPFTILELFDLCNLDINWDKLYLLYKKFMDISLIFI